jgi:hypothetical protein
MPVFVVTTQGAGAARQAGRNHVHIRERRDQGCPPATALYVSMSPRPAAAAY